MSIDVKFQGLGHYAVVVNEWGVALPKGPRVNGSMAVEEVFNAEEPEDTIGGTVDGLMSAEEDRVVENLEVVDLYIVGEYCKKDMVVAIQAKGEASSVVGADVVD